MKLHKKFNRQRLIPFACLRLYKELSIVVLIRSTTSIKFSANAFQHFIPFPHTDFIGSFDMLYGITN